MRCGTTARRPTGGDARWLEIFVDRHSVRVGAWLLWRTHGRIVRLWGRRALVLTTTGRKTGMPRTVVVQYFPDGRDFVVVAANSGMPMHPAWYLNLTARPEAQIEVDGRQLAVRARTAPRGRHPTGGPACSPPRPTAPAIRSGPAGTSRWCGSSRWTTR